MLDDNLEIAWVGKNFVFVVFFGVLRRKMTGIELEEGEAYFPQDGDDENIDPDKDFSYIVSISYMFS